MVYKVHLLNYYDILFIMFWTLSHSMKEITTFMVISWEANYK